MSLDTFLRACELAHEYGEYITLGGGEPTLHKRFREFVGIAIAYVEEGGPYIITNGSNATLSLWLHRLIEKEVVGGELSLDQFHDRSMVSDSVVEAFSSMRGDRFANRIRTVRQIQRQGRAITNGLWTEEEGCACDDLFVTPSGRLYACGHRELSFGTIFEPKIVDDYGEWEEKCSRKRKREVKHELQSGSERVEEHDMGR
jgi:MoaA/NifB/PqqE/SkfB family radical SAM enzyme